jgi:hypothetical protein
MLPVPDEDGRTVETNSHARRVAEAFSSTGVVAVVIAASDSVRSADRPAIQRHERVSVAETLLVGE